MHKVLRALGLFSQVMDQAIQGDSNLTVMQLARHLLLTQPLFQDQFLNIVTSLL